MTIQSYYANLSKIDFIDLASEVLLGMDKFIADLNRKQLAEGKRSDGSNITPEYKTITKILKSDLSGLAGVIDHVTLYSKGDLHKSITADIYSEKLVLDATDSKTPELLEKYGEWLGLTEESLVILRKEFLPRYVKALNKRLA